MPATTCQEATPDTYRVKTALRPDLFELLTVFGYEELRRRRAIMEFPFATLLIPYNIRKYCELFGTADYRAYLRSSHADKQELLSQVLRSTGITRASAEVVSAGRHEFVPERKQRLAYLNASTGVLGETNISAPAVVGYMLDVTSHWNTGAAVEIGVGTGFHAIALARLHPELDIVGIERNEAVLPRLEENIARAGMTERISVLRPGQEQKVLSTARKVYLTAAASQRQVRELVRLGGPDTEWLLPRQLTEREFTGEPESSWLKTRFGSFARYSSDQHWNSYCAIEGFSVNSNLESHRQSVIYDATFVKLCTTR
jgi:protein-L-isoaspartate O-methyltransferase